jgi:hypothetical protein
MALTGKQIKEIAALVSDAGYWGDGKPIFENLGLAKGVRATGGVDRRTRSYLEQADDETAERLLQYFEVAHHCTRCKPWPHRGYRLFISHRDDQREMLSKLRKALKTYGIASFLAHETIELGTIWRDELVAALKSMDAMFAYCSQGFSASDWAGQEVGYAFGKGIPTISVNAGEAPKGLLEPVQVAGITITNDDDARKLADLIFSQLKNNDSAKVTLVEGLVRQLKFAGSFSHAKYLASYICELGVLTPTARADLVSALAVNDQTLDLKSDEKFMSLV